MKKRLTLLSLLLALCLALSALESFLIAPLSLPLPGVKLGLSNLVILFCLSPKMRLGALCMILARAAFTALLFGNPVTLFFSLAGGLLSYGAMLLSLPLIRRGFSYVTVSLFGSCLFQIGQSLSAVLLYGPAVLYYLPLLLFAGIVTGAVIGLTHNLIVARLKKGQPLA